MQLNVREELRQRVGCVATYDVRERRLRLHDVELEDLAGRVTLLRTDRGLLVSIEATATLRERCSRCLSEADRLLKISFEEEYVPLIDATTGARVRIDKSEEVFRIGPDFVLDLREGLRQYVLMSESAKPLCRPDCAGLCAECGADLNQRSCECKPEIDTRWGALAGLKAQEGEGS